MDNNPRLKTLEYLMGHWDTAGDNVGADKLPVIGKFKQKAS